MKGDKLQAVACRPEMELGEECSPEAELRRTILNRLLKSELRRVLTWAAVVSVPLSWAMQICAAGLIHANGTLMVFLLAPAYVFLEQAGQQSSPTWPALMAYFLLQFAYYAALTAVLRWRLRTQGE